MQKSNIISHSCENKPKELVDVVILKVLTLLIFNNFQMNDKSFQNLIRIKLIIVTLKILLSIIN